MFVRVKMFPYFVITLIFLIVDGFCLEGIPTEISCVFGCNYNEIFDPISQGCISTENCDKTNCTKKFPNSHYTECGSRCIPTCQSLHTFDAENCTEYCVDGCVCNDGYIFDELSQSCVLPRNCPEASCGVLHLNAHLTKNGNYCRPICQNKCLCRKKKVDTYGCMCNEGYYYDRASGNCVLPENCPEERCPEGEEYTECNLNNEETCEGRTNSSENCMDDCLPGCVCKSGTVRDPVTSKCVHKEDCSKNECPENEMWMETGGEYLCSNLNKSPYVKFPACYCKAGFARDIRGICIPVEECPNEGGCEEDNTTTTLTPISTTYPVITTTPATNINYSIITPITTITFITNLTTTIYPTTTPVSTYPTTTIFPEPPETCSDPYSEYDNYGSVCEATCQNRTYINVNCSEFKPGCFCKSGYIKNEITGLCVHPKECPIVCRENEEKCCKDECEPTCCNPSRKSCVGDVCVIACRCRKGFVRNNEGRCVNLEACPRRCEDPNAEYENCGNPCENTCQNSTISRSCHEPCTPGCFCKSGFIRDESTQRCVRSWRCPKKCGYNEIPGCRNLCEPTCSNCSRKLCVGRICYPGCVCKPGYVRYGYWGRCIKLQDCPKMFSFIGYFLSKYYRNGQEHKYLPKFRNSNEKKDHKVFNPRQSLGYNKRDHDDSFVDHYKKNFGDHYGGLQKRKDKKQHEKRQDDQVKNQQKRNNENYHNTRNL